MPKHKIIKVTLIGIVILLLPALFTPAVLAEEARTVKVGYYEDGDYMYRNQDGDYEGFNFEYLYEISKYTDWDYQVVDCKSLENACHMLEKGEIDILPSTYYTEKRAESFSYSTLPICNIFTTLNVRLNDTRYDFEDYDSFNGMTVGVISGSKDIENFNKYCQLHHIQATVVPYKETASLLNALEDGTLDGIAITHMGRSRTFRSVAQFAPESLYIAVAKNKPELLTQLNRGMEYIQLRDPEYQNKLYNKYFSVSAAQNPVFTKEELEYISQVGTITALYDPVWAPVSYQDKNTGQFSGIAADLFHHIEEQTGLKFDFKPWASRKEAMCSLQDNSTAQVICCCRENYLWNAKNHIKKTRNYLTAPLAMVTNGINHDPVRVALSGNDLLARQLKEDYPEWSITYYDSDDKCFEALLSGAADVTYVNAYTANYLLTDPKYDMFSVPRLTNYINEIGIGVSQTADPRLFFILDKCIQYLSNEQLDEMILKNSVKVRPVAWQDLIRQYPARTVGGILAVFLLVTSVLTYALLLKSRDKKKIERLLYIDDLTGLWNLSRFRMAAESLLKNGLEKPYAIVYADIDQFKTINDTFGFSEGDFLLRSFAGVIKKTICGGEYCARVSADQFALLLRYEGWDSLLQRTETIGSKMNRLLTEGEKKYHAILSFGVYIIEENPPKDFSLMLDFASYARRTAKGSLKNTAVLYDEAMRRQELSRRVMADRMENALKNGEFVPYFQAKVNLITGEITGSEALVRWQVPGEGLLAPGSFLPFLEINRFVINVDLYIYEQVCNIVRRWIDEKLPCHTVSCNFSRLHLEDEDFPRTLAQIADRCQLPHSAVELEITESVVMKDQKQVLAQFHRLKDMGFRISIDDFGSGYSSLGLLQQMPVDVLKLDRSFLSDQTGDTKKKECIIRGIVKMAGELSMDVICEGVETKEQADLLMRSGCFTAQGFYYAEPLPLDAFEERFLL